MIRVYDLTNIEQFIPTIEETYEYHGSFTFEDVELACANYCQEENDWSGKQVSVRANVKNGTVQFFSCYVECHILDNNYVYNNYYYFLNEGDYYINERELHITSDHTHKWICIKTEYNMETMSYDIIIYKTKAPRLAWDTDVVYSHTPNHGISYYPQAHSFFPNQYEISYEYGRYNTGADWYQTPRGNYLTEEFINSLNEFDGSRFNNKIAVALDLTKLPTFIEYLKNGNLLNSITNVLTIRPHSIWYDEHSGESPSHNYDESHTLRMYVKNGEVDYVKIGEKFMFFKSGEYTTEYGLFIVTEENIGKFKDNSTGEWVDGIVEQPFSAAAIDYPGYGRLHGEIYVGGNYEIVGAWHRGLEFTNGNIWNFCGIGVEISSPGETISNEQEILTNYYKLLWPGEGYPYPDENPEPDSPEPEDPDQPSDPDEPSTPSDYTTSDLLNDIARIIQLNEGDTTRRIRGSELATRLQALLSSYEEKLSEV